MDNRIKVVDSHMGSGKTSMAIQTINGYDSDTKVIYITPYLDEVDRIVKSCPHKEFVTPDSKDGKTTKLRDLVQLIISGSNIVSTHALFKHTNDQIIDALRANNYILFLDEVFQTVDKFSVDNSSKLSREKKDTTTKNDIETLLKKNIISIEPDFRVKWVDDSDSLSYYNYIKNLSNRNLLYLVHGSLLMWAFPIEVFEEGIFSEIYILTHRFESQLQSYYYNYFEVPYTKYCVYHDGIKYLLTENECANREKIWKEDIKNKIHILDSDKLNKIGGIYYDSLHRSHESGLSKTWYESKKELIPSMRNNLSNYFINVAKSKAVDRLWTCFEDDVDSIKSRKVSKDYWLALNARATNKYADKTVLAYLINRYLDPFYDDFFEKKGIKIDQDEYALSEMLQWIFRSSIRNGNDIQLYIPSQRMRNLLTKYLES